MPREMLKPGADTDQGASPGASAAATVSHEAIAEAAYWRAHQRGFEPGHELEDWLAAERELMEREGAGVIG